MRISWIAPLAALSLAGCTQDGPLVDSVERYAAAVAATAAAFCRCPGNLGFETSQECMNDPVIGTLDDEQKHCMIDALEQDEEVSIAYLECMTSVERDFARCMVENPDCVDMVYTMENCVVDYAEGSDRCDSLPEDMRDAFMTCWSSAARFEALEERISAG